jgi:rhodanese-related sulfurtransferase
MKGISMFIGALIILCSSAAFADPALTTSKAAGIDEPKVMNEFRATIPQTAIKSIDELYSKHQEILAGKSKAMIVDIRREAEFDTGHLKNTNNIEAEMVYTVPKKITDPETEIWVMCRTKHRATYFAGMLYKYGYKNVYLVDGGIAAWAEKGYPLVNKYLGEIKVAKYQDKYAEEFQFRENK